MMVTKKVKSISCECDGVNNEGIADGPFTDEDTIGVGCRCSNDKDNTIIETEKLSIFNVSDEE